MEPHIRQMKPVDGEHPLAVQQIINMSYKLVVVHQTRYIIGWSYWDDDFAL